MSVEKTMMANPEYRPALGEPSPAQAQEPGALSSKHTSNAPPKSSISYQDFLGGLVREALEMKASTHS